MLHHVSRVVGVSKVALLRRGGVLVIMLALASTVSACGLITGKTVGGGPASVLQCSQATVGHGVDVVNIKVTCQASGAASGDTSFQLRYSVKSSSGTPRTFDAICTGTLHDGAGSCTQTYALVVPFNSDSPSVAGEFLPSHKPLGPMPLPINQ